MKCYSVTTCFNCPHYGHSGAFTQGGAIPLCGAVKDGRSKYLRKELQGTYNIKAGERTFDGTIPSWCPLPSR